MPNRLIKESIRTSKSVDALSDFDFRIWVYLITYVDDYGRGSADAELLKGLVFPRRKGLTEAQIKKAIVSLANTGMIHLYEVDGEPYLCFPNWDKHQQIRAKRSKFPAPDFTCNQMISDDCICPRNPIQSESNPNPNSEISAQAHTSAKKQFTPPTLEEIRAYCKERNSTVDPQTFYDYFEAGGWKDSEGKPVKAWKQKIITWERHEGGKKHGTQTSGRDAETRREEKRSKYEGFQYD